MRLRLTSQAEADLEDIAAYLEPRNPQGAQWVEDAILDVFALLIQYPEAGHLRGQRVRRFALPRYPYLVFYRVNEGADEIEVLTVRHAARREEN